MITRVWLEDQIKQMTALETETLDEANRAENAYRRAKAKYAEAKQRFGEVRGCKQGLIWELEDMTAGGAV
ncbi:hypothetical protein AGMMS50267_16520 [Spirochaetia bacterium]|nr:hypothetical protein AGMMS50267_16520 [Spirochaetia bacterium]